MLKKVWNSYNLGGKFLSAALSAFPNAHCPRGQLRAFTVGALLLLSLNLFAQTNTKSDGSASTGISMPTMPSVSQPSIGSGFYHPGRSDFYSGAKVTSQNKSKKSSSQSTSSTSETSKSQTTAPEKAKSNVENLNTLTTTANSSINMLTADDISSMNNLGILGSLSGLLGGKSSLQNQIANAQNTVTASTVDSATLKEILSELTELKNQMNNSGTKAENASLAEKSEGESSFTNAAKKEAKILRFIVNGYDLLATCKKLFFSETESDGTFLLTGDRKYLSEGKARSETFYFYFRAKGSENGITKYSVTPAVSQDYENKYSYLYQLTEKTKLTAERTGNLV
ncbi:MAG: hypothetical protein K5873_09035, partial [Treponema sp.]|nr:hypothetical protein [Treponema sp.]